jgi:transcriptional regulator with XRE-family HTH domain
MANENYAQLLIDKAAEKGLKRVDIAEALGVRDTIVTEWRSGKRKCKPADLAAIAYLAGFDATQILARATADEFEGTKKGQLLARALGKTLLATGVALTGVSAHSATTTVVDTMYIMLSYGEQ